MTDVNIREIEKSDLEKGFLESLDSLRKASDLESGKAQEVFDKIKSNPNHKIFVAVIDEKSGWFYYTFHRTQVYPSRWICWPY